MQIWPLGGALIRITLLVIPSVIFIFNLNKFKISNISKKIFLAISWMSIVALIALPLVPHLPLLIGWL